MLLFSLGVHAAGAALAAGQCWNAEPVSVDLAPERVWEWADAQFLRPFHLLGAGASLTQIRLDCTDPSA